MIEWDEAINMAKDELGIYGYTKDWDEVVEKAKDLIIEDREENPEEYKERKEEQKE